MQPEDGKLCSYPQFDGVAASPIVGVLLEASVTGGALPLTWQWYREGEPDTPVGGNQEWYVATEPGSYYVIVTDANGCWDQSDSLVVSPCDQVGLSLTKTGDRHQAEIGDVIEYTIEVRNTGLAELTNVTIVDAKLGLDVNIGTLGVEGTAVITGTYGPVTDGDRPEIVNTATATSDQTPPVGDAWTVTVGARPPCERTDVSVIIDGGWAGIPVKAWIGGSEQGTQTTAPDSDGRAAALFTFYPPADTIWTLRLEPQLPPGVDPAVWRYTSGSKSINIGRCEEREVHFQLVSIETPTPIYILPVTGSDTAPQPQGLNLGFIADWWQRLVRWCQGVLGLAR